MFKARCVLLVGSMIVFSLIAKPASATALGTGKVVQIGLSKVTPSLAFVEFSVNVNPNCTIPNGSQGHKRLYFDFTTEKGKVIMSMLTAAYLSSRNVSVMGDNVCITQQPDIGPNTITESVYVVIMK